MTLYSIFRSPIVQSYLARSVTAYISEELQAEIKIGGFAVDLSLSFIVEDISIEDKKGNNILNAEKIHFNIKNVNFKNKFLEIKEVAFKETIFNLKKYKNDTALNIQFLLNYFKSSNNSFDSLNVNEKKWAINCDNIILDNSQFSFSNLNKEKKKKGIDFNNLMITSINLDLNEINFYEETLYCRINNFSLKEISGFEINKFKGGIKISEKNLVIDHLSLITPNSEISMNLKFLYNDYSDFGDFINNIRIETVIGYSKLDIYDLGYFSPTLFEMPNKLTLSGEVTGTISDFSANNFKFSFGKSTNFVGDISMKGLPYFEKTLINFKINNLNTNFYDLKNFAVFGEDKYLELPELFLVLGDVNVKGSFAGFVDDFKTKAEISTDIGSVSTNMELLTNSGSTHYFGKIFAGDFDIGRFMNIADYFGKMDLNTEFNGSGLTAESVAVELNGYVDSLEFKGNNYNKIDIKGLFANKKFSGLLKVEDEKIDLTFDGTIDFNKEVPVFDFYSEINNAKLYDLGLFNRNPDMILSTCLNFNLVGDKLDDIEGKISIDSTRYSEAGNTYFVKNLSLVTIKDTAYLKSIELTSDFVNCKVDGNFLFASLYPAFCEFISKYLGALELTSEKKNTFISDQKMSFNIDLKNTHQLTKVFYPDLSISPNARISGGINFDQNFFELQGNSTLIEYKGIKYQDLTLNGTTNNNKLILNTTSKNIILREPAGKDTLGLSIENVDFTSNMRSDSLIFNIKWDDDIVKSRNNGNIDGFLAFENSQKIESKITNAYIRINNSVWNISRNNYVKIDSTSIKISDFEITSDKQKFSIKGEISECPTDSLTLELEDWSFSNFDPLIKSTKIDFDGILTGGVSLFDVYGSPYFFMDLKIKDLYFNEEKLGDAVLNTSWDNKNQSIYSNVEILNVGNVGTSKILSIDGNYYPNSDSTDYEYFISLSNFNLRALSPFVSAFISKLKGIASGEINLNSVNGKPNVTGNMQLMRSEAKINYLNVSYSFAHQIDFNKNEIVFKDMVLYDSLGNKAVANGKITHDYLNDFFLDIEIEPQGLACLNTNSYQNHIFYGKANASGVVKITGPFDNILMNIVASTDKGTKVNIPISDDIDVADNDYIIFVNSSDTSSEQPTYDVKMTGFGLNLEINATPDAEIELYLPFQLGRIKAVGNGDMKISVTPQSDFKMNGDYSIRKGTFYFTMQNLINRQFEIMDGSIISWTGNPYDANINIKALYKVKTNIDGLGLNIDSASGSGKRINVNCILQLKNQLFDPDIHFTIQLPNVDDETRQAVYSVLDTTNEVQMNQQMISLLVLGSFSYNTPSAGSIGASSVNILSNQLSNWLSQISQDFDVGIHYRQGDHVSEEELEVALSTQLFNDRVLIDGNFGVAGNEKSSNASNIVGDVNVEVKLTADGRFRVKAFNRSNVNSIYDINAFDDRSPYTQGVGIFYRKEFNTFGELFKRKKKKNE
ncbi:MAG: translocation/assembly module TamB [Bacteroidales bacterium]|nr:translocation/assembly module TamB [Bacteroidales bacterium]